MIKDILGGGMFETLADPVNCGCGCGCGTWGDDYRRGMDAGVSKTTHDIANPQ